MIQTSIKHQEVADFFARGQLNLFIGGDWSEPSDKSHFSAFDPGTGEALAEISEASEADVSRAVDVAAKAFSGPWSKFEQSERAYLMHKLADAVESKTEIITEIES